MILRLFAIFTLTILSLEGMAQASVAIGNTEGLRKQLDSLGFAFSDSARNPAVRISNTAFCGGHRRTQIVLASVTSDLIYVKTKRDEAQRVNLFSVQDPVINTHLRRLIDSISVRGKDVIATDSIRFKRDCFFDFIEVKDERGNTKILACWGGVDAAPKGELWWRELEVEALQLEQNQNALPSKKLKKTKRITKRRFLRSFDHR